MAFLQVGYQIRSWSQNMTSYMKGQNDGATLFVPYQHMRVLFGVFPTQKMSPPKYLATPPYESHKINVNIFQELDEVKYTTNHWLLKHNIPRNADLNLLFLSSPINLWSWDIILVFQFHKFDVYRKHISPSNHACWKLCCMEASNNLVNLILTNFDNKTNFFIEKKRYWVCLHYTRHINIDTTISCKCHLK